MYKLFIKGPPYWPLNVEPTYNLKATFSTKESVERTVHLMECGCRPLLHNVNKGMCV